MFYTVAFYGPVCNTIATLLIGYVVMKIVEDCIKLLGTYKTNIMEQNSSIEIINSKINDLQKNISSLEKKVQDNWVFISEEINDIYPAIKSINTEIMLIKNKICSSEH
jgi:hypothetical protein